MWQSLYIDQGAPLRRCDQPGHSCQCVSNLVRARARPFLALVPLSLSLCLSLSSCHALRLFVPLTLALSICLRPGWAKCNAHGTQPTFTARRCNLSARAHPCYFMAIGSFLRSMNLSVGCAGPFSILPTASSGMSCLQF